jgi:hypothetical protein
MATMVSSRFKEVEPFDFEMSPGRIELPVTRVYSAVKIARTRPRERIQRFAAAGGLKDSISQLPKLHNFPISMPLAGENLFR